MSLAREFDDASEAVGVYGVFERPKGITCQIEADEKLASPWEVEGLPSKPELAQWARSGRHVMGVVLAVWHRSIFHSSRAMKRRWDEGCWRYFEVKDGCGECGWCDDVR